MLAAIGNTEHWLHRVWVSSALLHCWLGNAICSSICHITAVRSVVSAGAIAEVSTSLSLLLCVSVEQCPFCVRFAIRNPVYALKCAVLSGTVALFRHSRKGDQMCRNTPDHKLHLADSDSFSAEYKNWFCRDLFNICALIVLYPSETKSSNHPNSFLCCEE